MRTLRLLPGVIALLLASGCQTEEQEQLTIIEKVLEQRLDEYNAILSNREERVRELAALDDWRAELLAKGSVASVEATLRKSPGVTSVTELRKARRGFGVFTVFKIEGANPPPDFSALLAEWDRTLPPSELLAVDATAHGWAVELATFRVEEWLVDDLDWRGKPDTFKPPFIPERGFAWIGVNDQRERVARLLARVEARFHDFDAAGCPELRGINRLKRTLDDLRRTRDDEAKRSTLSASAEAIRRATTADGRITWSTDTERGRGLRAYRWGTAPADHR